MRDKRNLQPPEHQINPDDWLAGDENSRFVVGDLRIRVCLHCGALAAVVLHEPCPRR